MAIHQDPSPQVATSVQTLDQVVSASVGQSRLMSTLTGLFAALAGVRYGVMAYNVRRQWREFGIRLAFGPSRATLARLVVGRTLALTGIGVGAGVQGMGDGSRAARDTERLQPWDSSVFALTAAAMLVVALLTSATPARADGPPVCGLRNYTLHM